MNRKNPFGGNKSVPKPAMKVSTSLKSIDKPLTPLKKEDDKIKLKKEETKRDESEKLEIKKQEDSEEELYEENFDELAETKKQTI